MLQQPLLPLTCLPNCTGFHINLLLCHFVITLTGQLAVSQVADWITRGLVNSSTTNFKKNMELLGLYFICTLNLTLTQTQILAVYK